MTPNSQSLSANRIALEHLIYSERAFYSPCVPNTRSLLGGRKCGVGGGHRPTQGWVQGKAAAMLQTIVLGAFGACVVATLIWQWREAVLADRGPATTSLHAPGFLPNPRTLPNPTPGRRRARPTPRVGGVPRRIHSAHAHRRSAA